MLKNYFLLVLVIVGISSCSNDFEIAAEWEDIPVVYALVDKADSHHYFRIQKAYLDGKGNALTLANIPDSLYYNNDFRVMLKKNDGEQILMDKVNAADVGIVKDTGVFADTPLYLYTLDSNDFHLDVNDDLKLILEHNGKVISTSQTNVVNTFKMRDAITELNFRYPGTSKQSFRWNTNLNNAAFFDLDLNLTYLESINDGPFEEKTITWHMVKNMPADENKTSFIIKVLGIGFYDFIQNNIEVNSNAVRILNNTEVVILAGGNEFKEYLDIQNVSGGITSAQFVPNYTNIENGRGLFSSRSMSAKNIPLNAATVDSLKNGIYTKDLNFE